MGAGQELRRGGPTGWRLGGVLGVLGLVGCHREVVPDRVRPLLPTAQELTEYLARPLPLARMNAPVRLRWTGRSPLPALDGNLNVEAPSRLRLDVFSPLGPPVAYFAGTEKRLDLYLPLAGNSFLHSPDPVGMTALVTGGVLKPTDIVSILLGGAPPCTVREVGENAARDRLVLSCAERPGTLELEPENRLFAGLSAPEAGGELAGIRVKSWTPLPDPHPLPAELELYSSKATASLTLESYAVPASFDPTLFQLFPPDGSRILRMESMVRGNPSAE